MAIARPRLFTAITGKMGAVEFAQRGKVTIIRNAKKPKTKVTLPLIEAQRYHALKIAIWKQYVIPYPNRLKNWTTYAATHPITNRIGQLHTLSPFQSYMSITTPFPHGVNDTIEAPLEPPRTKTPTALTATITAPSTFLVTIELAGYYFPYTTLIFHFSDPLSTNPHHFRYHFLTVDLASAFDEPPYNFDFTQRCTQLGYAWLPGQQVIVTLKAARVGHEPSLPLSYTATVAAP